jgi:outer membrane receptor protein involved in Fe transport
VLPAATLRYQVRPEQNIYLRFATGYRPGGFNSGVPTDIPNVQDLIPYDPEYAYGGELGWKASFLDGAWTVNLAAYYTRTRDFLATTAASETSTGFILQNAGNNHIYGVELETRVRIRLGAARLDLKGVIASSDGRLEAGSTVRNSTGALVDVTGYRVSRTRDYDLSGGADLTVPLASGVSGSLGVNVQSAGNGWENVLNTSRLSNYTLVDLTAGLNIRDWRIFAYVQNVGDKVYVLQRLSGNDMYSQPRRYGVSATVRF